MQDGFRLLDLYSQSTAVQQHIAGWQAQRILDWLGAKGRLELVMPESQGGHAVYRFTSSIGREANFFVDRDGLRLM